MTPCIQAGYCLTNIASFSERETIALGAKIARRLKPGAVVALRGGLGAGKTCLVKGIAQGMGITGTVTSPTYTIICEYEGPVPLYHIDAYRLSGDEDFENTGAGEMTGGTGITVIEWSERLPRSLPPDVITISITISGPQSRLFNIDGLDIDNRELDMRNVL